MKHDEAMQLASGYAWGREDASGLKTAVSGTVDGPFAFGTAFAEGWDAYNNGEVFSMMPVRDAYERWQATRGCTIWAPDAGPEWAKLVRTVGFAEAHATIRRQEEAAEIASYEDAVLARIESSACDGK